MTAAIGGPGFQVLSETGAHPSLTHREIADAIELSYETPDPGRVARSFPGAAILKTVPQFLLERVREVRVEKERDSRESQLRFGLKSFFDLYEADEEVAGASGGFMGYAIKIPSKNLVLALYRGTVLSSPMNLLGDIGLAGGHPSWAHHHADEFAANVRAEAQRQGLKVAHLGHSLGGDDATPIAYAAGEEAYAIDPVGAGSLVEELYGAPLDPKRLDKVFTYTAPGSFISEMHRQVGQQFDVLPTEEDKETLEALDRDRKKANEQGQPYSALYYFGKEVMERHSAQRLAGSLRQGLVAPHRSPSPPGGAAGSGSREDKKILAGRVGAVSAEEFSLDPFLEPMSRRRRAAELSRGHDEDDEEEPSVESKRSREDEAASTPLPPVRGELPPLAVDLRTLEQRAAPPPLEFRGIDRGIEFSSHVGGGDTILTGGVSFGGGQLISLGFKNVSFAVGLPVAAALLVGYSCFSDWKVNNKFRHVNVERLSDSQADEVVEQLLQQFNLQMLATHSERAALRERIHALHILHQELQNDDRTIARRTKRSYFGSGLAYLAKGGPIGHGGRTTRHGAHNVKRNHQAEIDGIDKFIADLLNQINTKRS